MPAIVRLKRGFYQLKPEFKHLAVKGKVWVCPTDSGYLADGTPVKRSLIDKYYEFMPVFESA